jgi:ubiquitin carboxyl-terminal hydrolase 25/28
MSRILNAILPCLANTYFQFNDETVRMTNAKEVLQDTTGSNANPYLLVYAKKGSNAIEVMTRERKQLLAEMSAAPPAPETAV